MSKLHPGTKHKGWQECEACRRDIFVKTSWRCPYCGFDNNPSAGIVLAHGAAIASMKSVEAKKRLREARLWTRPAKLP